MSYQQGSVWKEENGIETPKVSSTLHWKSRLNRNGDWYFMVPEGNSSTRGHTGVFINRNKDRHVMACHMWPKVMDILSSLT